jgi:hypothetical protein
MQKYQLKRVHCIKQLIDGTTVQQNSKLISFKDDITASIAIMALSEAIHSLFH